MPDFVDHIKADWGAVIRGAFSKPFTISNGTQSVAVRGLFDEQYQETDPETQVPVMSSGPRLTVFKSDVPFAIKQGTLVTEAYGNNRAFKVRTPQPDGEGAVILLLERA